MAVDSYICVTELGIRNTASAYYVAGDQSDQNLYSFKLPNMKSS